MIDQSLSTCRSIAEIKKQTAQVNMFQNPVSTSLNLSVAVGQKPISSLHLFDVTGRMVAGQTNLNATNTTLDVKHVSNGLYLLNVTLTDGTWATQKVTIQQ